VWIRRHFYGSQRRYQRDDHQNPSHAIYDVQRVLRVCCLVAATAFVAFASPNNGIFA
jgi:hypothetical protein